MEFDHRMADTYGTLIGGYWCLVSNKDFLQDNEKINEFLE